MKETGVFLTAVIASFGIAVADLPELMAWSLVIVIFTLAVILRGKIQRRVQWATLFFTLFSGICMFAAEWHEIWIFAHIPSMGIGAGFGYIVATIFVYANDFRNAVFGRIRGGK